MVSSSLARANPGSHLNWINAQSQTLATSLSLAMSKLLLRLRAEANLIRAKPSKSNENFALKTHSSFHPNSLARFALLCSNVEASARHDEASFWPLFGAN